MDPIPRAGCQHEGPLWLRLFPAIQDIVVGVLNERLVQDAGRPQLVAPALVGKSPREWNAERVDGWKGTMVYP